jgi:hypothetical protein
MKALFYSGFLTGAFLKLISKPKYDFDFLLAWVILCGIMIIFLSIKDYVNKRRCNK